MGRSKLKKGSVKEVYLEVLRPQREDLGGESQRGKTLPVEQGERSWKIR